MENSDIEQNVYYLNRKIEGVEEKLTLPAPISATFCVRTHLPFSNSRKINLIRNV